LKRSIKPILFLSIIIFTLFASTMNTESTNQQEVIDSIEPDYLSYTINDFSDFFIYDNDSIIDSNLENTHTSFDYSGGSSGIIAENYVLTFDEYGDCSDFDIKLKFQYETHETAAMMSFYMYTGSYYDYLGNYLGTDYSDSTQHLSYAGVYDAWSGSKGEFVSVAYVNDVFTRYETGHIVPYDGFVTVQLTRNSSGLYSLVYDTFSETLLMGHSWVAGIDKPVNFVMLEFRIGPTSTPSQVTAYEIEGELIFADYPDTIDPYVDITYPSNNTYIPADSATIIWEGYDLESGLDRYYTKLDSENWIDVGLAISYSYYNLTYGYHTVEVSAVDNENNNFNDTVTFFSNITQEEPDSIKPFVFIISPSNSTITTNEDVTVTWLGYDLESGIKEYQIRLDYIAWLVIGLNTSFDFYSMTNGTHIIEVMAVDNNGNNFTSFVQITIFIAAPEPDIIAPELTIHSPINNSIIPLSSITVIWSGNDNDSGLMEYHIRIDNGDWINVNLTTYYNYVDLTDGVHIVEVKAIDNELNERLSLITFTISTAPSTAASPGFTMLLAISALISIIMVVRISLRFKTKK